MLLSRSKRGDMIACSSASRDDSMVQPVLERRGNVVVGREDGRVVFGASRWQWGGCGLGVGVRSGGGDRPATLFSFGFRGSK